MATAPDGPEVGAERHYVEPDIDEEDHQCGR